MRRLALAFCLLAATPAGATSILVDDANTFTLTAPNTVDQIVVIDTGTIVLDGGAVTGNITLLDSGRADLHAGSVGGTLRAFDDSLATLFVEPGTGEVDGLGVPDGTILAAVDCPTCTIAGTLADATSFSTTADVLLGGHVQIVAVPEPSTAALMLLGLTGLALAGRREP